MSDTPEQNIQADDAQAQAGGNDANAELLNKIALLEANNKKLLAEKRTQAHQLKTCSVKFWTCKQPAEGQAKPACRSW